MTRFRSMDSLKAYLAAQMQKEEGSGEERHGPRLVPFVTISRQTGAGGRSMADALADCLNDRLEPPDGSSWTIFDRNLLDVVIEEHHLPEEYMKYMEEDVSPSLQEAVAELLNFHPSIQRLVAKTCRTILHLATMGNAILVGRGGNLVTKHARVGLRVRLVGSAEKRVERVIGHYGLTEKEARSFMKTEDEGRQRYVKTYFDADIEDATTYDLVLNTDRAAPDIAARIAAEAMAIKWEER